MLKIFDPRQLVHAPARELHNGSWTDYAEVPSRAAGIAARLGDVAAASDHGMGPLRRVHTNDYLDFLTAAHGLWREAGRPGDAIPYVWPVVHRRALRLERIDALLGRYSYDAATPIAEGTWEAAYWAAQTALTGLDALLSGEARGAFALSRPPGHHAGPDYCGGYCYINNAAVAARAACDAGHSRVALLDIDYHHGNGSQDIFLEDGSVFFASLHADPATDYPFYWGHADEKGAGAGEGTTLNLPLPRGTGLAVYLDALDRALDAIGAFDPTLLVLSFGADTFEDDPISHFRLGTGDYPVIAGKIAAAGLPTLIVMEGGYAVGALGENVDAFLQGF